MTPIVEAVDTPVERCPRSAGGTAVLAACHIHSMWSYDGRCELDEVARFFACRGCDALFMTEHDRGFSQERFDAYRAACEHAGRANGILVVPGIEYSDSENVVHVLTWGLQRFLGTSLPTLGLLRQVQDLGGVSVMAHPSRRDAWRQFDSAWAALLLGIELWNRKTDGFCPSNHAGQLLSEHAQLRAFVGLDFHRARQSFPLRMQLAAGTNAATAVSELCRASGVFLGRSETVWRSGICRGGLWTAESARRSVMRAVRRSWPPRRSGGGASGSQGAAVKETA